MGGRLRVVQPRFRQRLLRPRGHRVHRCGPSEEVNGIKTRQLPTLFDSNLASLKGFYALVTIAVPLRPLGEEVEGDLEPGASVWSRTQRTSCAVNGTCSLY